MGDDVSVLRFEKADGKFSSTKITDVSVFNIEQLILDEFKVTYRPKEELKNIMSLLRKKDDKQDPIRETLETDELKIRIDRLYKEIAE